MSNKNDRPKEEQLDPQLVELLDQLRPTPPRSPEAVKRSRERFLAEMESWSQATSSPPARLHAKRQPGFWWGNPILTLKETITMLSSKNRIAFAAIAVILIVFVFLFGGTAMTALAAQSALPGDTLYPVKTTLERTRLSLSGDAARRAQLQLQYAERRLGEIESLIAEGRFRDISTATQEFETHIINALAEFSTISSADPARAAELMSQITQSLTRYGEALRNMLDRVPEPVRTEMLQSIRTIQGVGDDGNLNGNENGNENDGDGSNQNGNENGNENDGDGSNQNGNENGDDDDDNGNQNGNGDDGNQNGNQNGNGDDDDNGNDDGGNLNGNQNGDDGGGGGNQNDNDDDNGGGGGNQNDNQNGDDDNGGGGGNQNGDDDNGNDGGGNQNDNQNGDDDDD